MACSDGHGKCVSSQVSEVALQMQGGQPAARWGRAPYRQAVMLVWHVSERFLFVIFNVHVHFSSLDCRFLEGRKSSLFSLQYSLTAAGTVFSRCFQIQAVSGGLFTALLLLPGWNRVGPFIFWGVDSSPVKRAVGVNSEGSGILRAYTTPQMDLYYVS